MPRASKEPAKIKLKKDGVKIPTTKFKAYRPIPEMIKVVQNQAKSILSLSDSRVDSLRRLGMVPMIAPAKLHRTKT